MEHNGIYNSVKPTVSFYPNTELIRFLDQEKKKSRRFIAQFNL